jgi:hypothetical protein
MTTTDQRSDGIPSAVLGTGWRKTLRRRLGWFQGIAAARWVPALLGAIRPDRHWDIDLFDGRDVILDRAHRPVEAARAGNRQHQRG